jgi:hypothetical protein
MRGAEGNPQAQRLPIPPHGKAETAGRAAQREEGKAAAIERMPWIRHFDFGRLHCGWVLEGGMKLMARSPVFRMARS